MKPPDPILLCYGSGTFVDARDHLAWNARQVGGFRKIRACSRASIPRAYRRAHASILQQRRGDGYWLWKPFLIHQTLKKMDDGAVLFYCDSGVHFLAPATPLLRLAEDAPIGVVSFRLEHIERRYTKRAALDRLGLDRPEIRDTTQHMASFVLFRACDASRAFVDEWLRCCEDELLLTDLPSPPPLSEYPDFVAHRHDQSLFSLVCKKHGVVASPDPSQWGNNDPDRSSFYPQILQHTRGFDAPLSPVLAARFRRAFRRFAQRLHN